MVPSSRLNLPASHDISIRLAMYRDVGIGIAVIAIGVYLMMYRTTAVRDLADLRNEIFKARAETQDINRTASGVGKSFDTYRDEQKVREAELSGQISVTRRIVSWALGILTTLLVAALLAWLKL